MDFSLGGIQEIAKVYMSCPQKKDADEARHVRVVINSAGEFEPIFNEWYFQTDGSNLLKVLRFVTARLLFKSTHATKQRS